MPEASAPCRLELAAPGGARRRGVGAAALPARPIIPEGATAATGLAKHSSRAEAAGRDAAAAVGGVPRRASRRSRIFLVLRDLSGVEGPPHANDAANTHRRRADVRRLLR